MHQRGLPLDINAQFALDRDNDGIPNGLDYAFSTNRVDGALLTIRHTSAGPVAETAVKDPDTAQRGFFRLKAALL